MIREPIVFVGTSDLAGLFRGKSVAERRLRDEGFRGVGWVPTNALITCFDAIGDTPYGSIGDLLIVPDLATSVHVDFEDDSTPEHFVIGDIETLDGKPFACCTRAQLSSALRRLNAASGLQLVSTFEQEFQFQADASASRAVPSFSLHGHRDAAAFGETLMAALQTAGLHPESFIKEYGLDQYEVPVGVARGIASADQAVILRELVHATARRFQRTASFNPLRAPDGVGNGVHVHFSFLDADGVPVTYDAQGQHGLSRTAGAFVAGVLKYLPVILCLTAPAATSYLRLTPHRWSAAYNNLGAQDREASLRLCPLAAGSDEQRARQFNIEYRAADAAASPHLVLAAIVHAGTQGIEEQLPTPQATVDDLSLLDAQALQKKGIERLPTTLEDALMHFADSDVTGHWFGDEFKGAYLDLKRTELSHVAALSAEERCAAYARIF